MLLAFCKNGVADSPAYRLGNGMNIGSLNVAGYSNIEEDAPRGKPDKITGDVSMFLSGHFNRYLNPFSEIEIDQFPIFRQPSASASSDVSVERLYDDAYLGRASTLRLGKLLTPLGEWNLIHAPPLVWTVTRPVVTYYSFPTSITGAALSVQKSYHGDWDLHIYAQPNLDALWKSGDHTPRPYSHVVGIDLRYSWDPLSRYRVGVSWQRADLPESGGSQQFSSIYGGFATGRLRWSFQGNITDIHGSRLVLPRTLEVGGYLQAVYSLAPQWYLVAQGERYLARDYQEPMRRRLVGLVYRPRPAVSWKLDFVDTSGAPIGSPTGIYAAWAVLF